MPPFTYPEITRVEVIATQPIPADIRSIEYLQATENTSLNEVTYLVKINLSHSPPITSRGITVYVDDYAVRRYSSFPGGIYFKVFDPGFFQAHAGKKILFSIAGVTMHDSGYQLPANAENASSGTMNALSLTLLPTQKQVLNP